MGSIEVLRIDCGSDNCYVLKSGDASVLVDTCKTKERQRVLSVTREQGVRAVVLTHGHFDHCQNAAAIARELDVPVAMHSSDVELAADNTLQVMRSSTFLGKALQFKSAREFKSEEIEPFEVSVLLDEGDSLSQFGIAANVIALPGHTLGSIGIDAGDAGVIVGDALINVPSARKAMIYVDKQSMERSAEKIASLGKRTLWYGHGNPTENWLAESRPGIRHLAQKPQG